MKKVIKIFLCVLVFVLLMGCTTTYTNTNKENNNGNIGVIETYNLCPNYSYEVFYDKDTGVCYIAIGEGVTPLYNADGSLKIYGEDKE